MNIAAAALPERSLNKLPTGHPLGVPVVVERYLPDSETYQLKGGYHAEVIENPGPRLARAGQLDRAEKELTQVVLRAFEKHETEAEHYAPRSVMTKNVLRTDWLVVVRKNGMVVAISSATQVSSYLIYLNSAMVDPAFQTSGIGLIASALLWKRAIESASVDGKGAPDLICRTHNRSVVSVMLSIFKKSGWISTEPSAIKYTDMAMKRIIDFLNCTYDPKTGISRDVYPEGLPTGHKDNDPRIRAAFENVGARDALYVMGHADMRFINRLVERNIVLDENVIKHQYEVVELKMVA